MRKTTLFSILVLILILIFVFFIKRQEISSLKKLKIGEKIFFVEIADTIEKKEKGLSGRDFLPPNQGMLFVFDVPNYYPFWMKDMKFPLDFIWIFENTIVEISENIKPSDYQPPKILVPREKVDKVLEVNAGFVKKFNIKVGDEINLQN